jgi:hypothetical protein
VIDSSESLAEGETAESALLRGWDCFLRYCEEWRLSFNLYMLEEYLQFGGKSFLKKDREILFTGIANLYSELVPTLAGRRSFRLLKEFAVFNNALYRFHPSFNYFHLFTLLLPLHDEFEPVFHIMKEVLEKCLRTNILTPLLFGVLRHREAFLQFIKQVDSPIWLPYLNAILAGIIINLKFRILEYEEILELFERAVCKAGLLGSIRTEEITGTLEEGWKEAKEFFISAVKVGFNSGEVQTWKTVDFESIGRRVIANVLDGMLLNTEDNPSWEVYLGSPEEKLSSELRVLSENKLDWHSIKSWVSQLERPIDSEAQVYSLIRMVNLIHISQAQDEYCVNFLICSILGISCPLKRVAHQRVEDCVSTINRFLSEGSAENWTFVKEKVIELHQKYRPSKDIAGIIGFYFRNYEPKKGFSTLLEVLDLEKEDICNALAAEVGKHFTLPVAKFVKMRTFERELLVRNELVNAPYEGHCILSTLTAELMTGKQPAQRLIARVIAASPRIAFALLNFPVNLEGRLFSFGTYLIEHPPHHALLRSILGGCRGVILSEEKVDLIAALSLPGICEQINKRIN